MLEEHCDRLDLLPFYGRLVATLEPVMPDLAVELSQSLIQQFRMIVRNQSKLRVDRKVRCCRFISELVSCCQIFITLILLNKSFFFLFL